MSYLRLSRFLVLLACSLPLSVLSAVEPARRIASMNLCSDQLLLLLAEKAHIASLSYIAADPEYSPLAEQTTGIHLNHGQAEELLPLQPDLIITSQFSATLAANLLERLHFDVLRLGIANSTQDIYAQITSVAERSGSQIKAAQLIASMQNDIAALSSKVRAKLQGKVALFYSSNGFSYGSNTLQDEFIRSVGMHNAAAHLQGPAQLSLEVMLRSAPDYIIINPPARSDQLLAHPLLQHPALAALKQQGKVLILADSHFQCAGPAYVQAYADLAQQL